MVSTFEMLCSPVGKGEVKEERFDPDPDPARTYNYSYGS